MTRRSKSQSRTPSKSDEDFGRHVSVLVSRNAKGSSDKESATRAEYREENREIPWTDHQSER